MGKMGCIYDTEARMYIMMSTYAVRSVDDNKYHIGLWVRDNTAGMELLHFMIPDS